MSEDLKLKTYEILKVLLTRPFARVFWRMAARKAFKIASYLENMK